MIKEEAVMEAFNRLQDITIAASQSNKEREYWFNQLSGSWVKSNFPYDFEKTITDKPAEPSEITGADKKSVKFTLPAELFSRIMKLSNGSDSRIHMIFIAAVTLLLHRYTGNSDIIIGIPVDKQDIEGEFVNTALALRNTLEPHLSFKELLLQVRETVLQAAENQNYPIEVLLYDLDMNVNQPGFPLFDVVVLLENLQEKRYLRDINVNIIFSFLRTNESINGVLEYNPLLYRESMVLKISKHLNKVLEQVLPDVNVKIENINILLEEEKKILLSGFNNTCQEYSGDKTLHQLFEEQVKKRPHHIAVSCIGSPDGQVLPDYLSYSQLNEKANRLAWILKSKGVQQDVFVGLMVKNPMDLAASILGILKAGTAYLPFSLRYPEERVRYMLKDSQARILFKDGEPLMGESGTSRMEELDIKDLSRRSSPTTNLPAASQPTAAAYIIYTSGTTGKPRGVVVEHHSAVNTLVCRKKLYRLNPRIKTLQLFSPAFDGFVTGFFTPIIAGASVVLLSEEDIMDIARVKTAVVQNQVNHFISIPSLYQAIIEELAPGETSSLKVVTLAGDKLSPQLLKKTKEKSPDLEIAQEYGVTEAAVMSTLFRHQEKESRLKIGSPIANTRIYIVDRYFRPLPLGVPGELCISGAGVARGYLNRPELTAEKFNHDLWNLQDYYDKEKKEKKEKKVPGKRVFHMSYMSHMSYIYKTGDLARWMPDGNIEFLGRIDFQVKIMGFRIELGEIENQLLKHEQVKEAVVMSRETPKGRKYLCAYVTPYSPDSIPTHTQLRDFLMRLLPDYMVPPYFLVLDRIPLTPNGKIDRKQLPQPDDIANVEYVAPKNELEKNLVEIWQHELKLEQVGINDNYFNIGGDSIKSVKLINIINKKLNIHLKIADLYANNTIVGLAELIKEKENEVSTANAEYEKALGKLEEMKNKYIKGVMSNAG
jgi:amino acid adenylation domain-containing protein